MKRRIFEKLSSADKIFLKNKLIGFGNLPKLVKFQIYDSKIYWKNVEIIKEHTLLDQRLNFLLKLKDESLKDIEKFKSLYKDSIYWTDGNKLYDLNKSLRNQIEIKESKNYNNINNYNLIFFKKEEMWKSESKKINSNAISPFIIDQCLNKISPFYTIYGNSSISNEEILINQVYKSCSLDLSEYVNPDFDSYQFYENKYIPYYLVEIFKNNAYKSLVLGVYQKLLTEPNDENLILLGCLNIKINKINKI